MVIPERDLKDARDGEVGGASFLDGTTRGGYSFQQPIVPQSGNPINQEASSGSGSGAQSYIDRGYTPERAAEKIASKSGGDEYADKARKGIEDRYDSIGAGFEKLLGYLPEQQAAQRGDLAKQRDFSRGNIESGLDQSISRLSQTRGRTIDNQEKTLRDLSSDVRNAFMAGNIYLGARGASNSSAAGMYSLGVQQSANRNRADVKSQVAQSLSDLDMRVEDAHTTANNSYREIDHWFETATSELARSFQAQKQEIEMAMANASADEQASLQELDMELWRNAENQYNALLEQAQTGASGVQSQIDQINKEAQAEANKIQGLGDVNPLNPESGFTGRNLIDAPFGMPNEQGQIPQFTWPGKPREDGFTGIAGR